MSVDLAKQKAVIVRALEAPDADGRLGRTREWLRHLLFLVDMEAYGKLGASITGARYRRGVRAPIVEGLTRSLRDLEAEGVIGKSEPSS